MNAVDASSHYNQRAEEDRPSLLVVILDTNPFAWDILSSTLSISQALANILLFINAHLAFSHANKAAVIASHTKSARLLYPITWQSQGPGTQGKARPPGGGPLNLVDRLALEKLGGTSSNGASTAGSTPGSGELSPGPKRPLSISMISDPERDANKYRQFRIVEDEVAAGLRKLMDETTEDTLEGTNMTMMAGALTLALTFIHKTCMPMEDTTIVGTAAAAAANTPGGCGGTNIDGDTIMSARILVVSVSGDLAVQYIPIMNCIFAAQRKKIPIDICKIAGDTVFLQQASDATNGIYMSLEDPRGLLQYLMMAFLPDQSSRKHLVLPTQVNVDFRAACFCHKRVVDIGFVCSICLSIFCSPPAGSICSTCGTKLDVSSLGVFGGKPVVMVTKKKKKRKADLAVASGDE